VDLVLLDSISFSLVLLRLWVTLLILLVSFYVWKGDLHSTSFFRLCILMLLFLVLSFSTTHLLLFYILFEASLIPIFLLVLG
jgi:NADH-quinone oxidoreductase subunit M